MGCFSFLCKKTGKPALSSSFSGSRCHLFLLKDGKVIEHMYGNYDSYGRVFKNTKDPDDQSQTKYSSFNWKMDWSDVCSLIFDKNPENGIACILEPAFIEGEFPTEQSEQDPDQGWGEGFELLGSSADDLEAWVDNPFHKIY